MGKYSAYSAYFAYSVYSEYSEYSEYSAYFAYSAYCAYFAEYAHSSLSDSYCHLLSKNIIWVYYAKKKLCVIFTKLHPFFTWEGGNKKKVFLGIPTTQSK